MKKKYSQEKTESPCGSAGKNDNENPTKEEDDDDQHKQEPVFDVRHHHQEVTRNQRTKKGKMNRKE